MKGMVVLIFLLAVGGARKEITWDESKTPWRVERNVFSTDISGTIYTIREDITDFELEGAFRVREIISKIGLFAVFIRANPLVWNARAQLFVNISAGEFQFRDCTREAPIGKLVDSSFPLKRWIPIKVIVKGNKAYANIGGVEATGVLPDNLKAGAIALHSNGIAVDFKLKRLRIGK